MEGGGGVWDVLHTATALQKCLVIALQCNGAVLQKLSLLTESFFLHF